MSKNPPIIGLTGFAGSGKDTAYNALAGALPSVRFERRAFADLVKQSAMRALGIDPQHAEEFKRRGRLTIHFGHDRYAELSGREFLQRYGTEAHRDLFGHDFWTNLIISPDVLPPDAVTVVTDVRFDDEAERIRGLGGEVWKVVRPGNPSTDPHATEAGVSPELVDRYVQNDGTVDELADKMASAFGMVAC